MKKHYVLLLSALLFCTSFLFASVTVDTYVPFNGSSEPSAKFLYPIYKDYVLVTGFSATFPAEKTRESDYDFLLGINHPMPILGVVDMYGIWHKTDRTGTKAGTESGTEIRLQKFVVSKRFVQPLTDRINLGLEAVFAEIFTDGTKETRVLPSLYPVVGMTIDLLN